MITNQYLEITNDADMSYDKKISYTNANVWVFFFQMSENFQVMIIN